MFNNPIPKGQVLCIHAEPVHACKPERERTNTNFTDLIPANQVGDANGKSLFAAELRDSLLSYSRKWAEQNPNFLQLLPYVVLIDQATKKILTYKRGKEGSEARLHDLRSIGFGGHIDSVDDYATLQDFRYDFDNVIAKNVARELEEETGFDISPENFLASAYFKGLLVSDSPDIKEVGHFHLGLLFVLEVDSSQVTKTNEANVIDKMAWLTYDQVMQLNLEPWSKVAAVQAAYHFNKA